MDVKIILSIVATIIGTAAFLPYLIDIYSLKTKPHIYTWLIWGITQGTATVGILRGGGSWGALNLIVGTVFVIGIFLFSLKYGTRNITKIDTIVLLSALGAVFIWWQLNSLLLAVIFASAIDVLGYLPSFRKTYSEPWSETLLSWLAFAVSDILAILALSEYNLLTTTYLVSIAVANISLFLLCFFRRRFISKPSLWK